MVFVSLRYHWDLLESSCHNFCTLLFAFCNKIQFLFDMVVYLLTYPVLTFNTNPLIARCLSALCRRSWGKDYSRPPPPPRFGAEIITITVCELSSLSDLSSGRGGAPSRFPNSGWWSRQHICCGSILFLIQILFSFVSNSLTYITTPKHKRK